MSNQTSELSSLCSTKISENVSSTPVVLPNQTVITPKVDNQYDLANKNVNFPYVTNTNTIQILSSETDFQESIVDTAENNINSVEKSLNNNLESDTMDNLTVIDFL